VQVDREVPGEPAGRGRLRLALVLGAVATFVWVALAAAMAGRGFGGANEGYYLLSYDRWDDLTRTFSGAQYVYGPLFDLLGDDVVLLRLFRLLTIVVVDLLFGWQFMTWLRTVRDPRRSTTLWRAAGTLAITASGGVVYGWLPGTPGYNDLTIFGATGLLACFFRLQVRRAAGLGPGALACFAFGMVAVVMVLAKATMIPCVVVALVALWLALRPGRDRVVALVWLVAGAGSVLLVQHLLVKPLDESVPPLIHTLRVVGRSGHRPADLVWTYLSSVAQAAGLGAAAFVAPGLVMMLALRRGTGRLADLSPWIAVGVNLALIGLAGGLHGGLRHVGAYQAGIVAMVLTGIAAAVWGRASRRGAASGALVLAMPLLAALGTNNPLMAVAVGGAALWVAVLVLLLSGIDPAYRAQRTLAALATAGAVTVCFSVAVTGATHTADGERLIGTAVRHVDGVPLLASVEVPRDRARRLERLRAALAPYVEPAGRPMIAFGELADLVLVLNGRPVGNAWFSAREDGLQAADLRAACAHGNPWTRQPVVLTVRTLTDGERAGFEACGLDVDRDYTTLVPEPGSDLRVLVPSVEAPAS
jgi:hypothetical protein